MAIALIAKNTSINCDWDARASCQVKLHSRLHGISIVEYIFLPELQKLQFGAFCLKKKTVLYCAYKLKFEFAFPVLH